MLVMSVRLQLGWTRPRTSAASAYKSTTCRENQVHVLRRRHTLLRAVIRDLG